jgi:poly-beta-1,6-N-acetyl-D-glucosamine synthase
MVVFLLIVFGFYFCCLLALWYGWEKMLSRPIQTAVEIKPITVLIPFRDEERNIERLLYSLSSLEYPDDKLQIILINDHSTDTSLSLIEMFRIQQAEMLHLAGHENGKKAALSKGVQHAKFEIIVTTDADCFHHTNWLHSVNAMFADEKIKLMVGPVAIRQTKRFFGQLQAIEFSSLIGSGAALLHGAIPAMANGANFAFRKATFNQVHGYDGNEHIASGDDEFLLKKIFEAHPDGVVFNNQPDSVVRTLPQLSLKDFFQQRFRWAGKWKHQSNVKVKSVAVLVFLFQLMSIVAWGMMFGEHAKMVAVLLVIKALAEGCFLYRVSSFLKSTFSLVAFALLQIIYPLYVVFTGVASIVVRPSWKSRGTN